MTILKNTLCTLSILFASSLAAQDNYIKVAGIQAVFNRDLSVAYERTFNNFGLQAHVTHGREKITYIYETDPANPLIVTSSEDFKRRLSTYRLDVRYYVLNQKEVPGTGLFLGVVGQLMLNGKAEDAYYEAAENHSGMIPDIESTVPSQGGLIGYKWLVKDVVSFDLALDTRFRSSRIGTASSLSIDSQLHLLVGFRF